MQPWVSAVPAPPSLKEVKNIYYGEDLSAREVKTESESTTSTSREREIELPAAAEALEASARKVSRKPRSKAALENGDDLSPGEVKPRAYSAHV